MRKFLTGSYSRCVMYSLRAQALSKRRNLVAYAMRAA